ncbi:MAG TPA: hypothetical protein VGC23_01230 [Vicinamibacterales bacterium]
MTKAGRKSALVLVAAATMILAGRANAQDVSAGATPEREAIVVVHIVNYAALSRGVLDEARTRAAGIYDAIGVHTEWVVGEDPLLRARGGGLNLTVLLLSPDMAEKKISAERLKDGVLGQAHPVSGRAHVFCARIATIVGDPRYFAIPLGDVIAHEVGHLLLQTNGHSPTGIMRASMDVQDTHPRSFNKAQALAIRNSLKEREARTLARNEEVASSR